MASEPNAPESHSTYSASKPSADQTERPRPAGTLITRVIAGRYEVLEVVGEGPLLVVLRARDRSLNRVVAVKGLLQGHIPSEGPAIVRKLREGWSEILSLNHSGITRAYDVGADVELGLPVYVAEEYVRGIDLKERIRRAAPFQLSAATDCAIALAEVLEFSHSRGITHGDVRPQNILVGPEGQVKLTNFGVAEAQNIALYQDPALLRRVVAYIAPEAASTARPGISADLYALGVVLFEMLTGDVPFKGDNPVQIALKHAQEPAPSPRGINPSVPRALEGIVLKALEKRPSDRYLSAAGMLVDLREVRDALRFGKSLSWSPRDRGGSTTPTTVDAVALAPASAVGAGLAASDPPEPGIRTRTDVASPVELTAAAATAVRDTAANVQPRSALPATDDSAEMSADGDATIVMPRRTRALSGEVRAAPLTPAVQPAAPVPEGAEPPALPPPAALAASGAARMRRDRGRAAAIDQEQDDSEMNERGSGGGGGRWLTFVNLFLGLILLAGIGTLVYYALNFFQPESEVVVPNLVGKLMPDAQGLAVDEKFTLAVVDQQYEDKIPADTIYMQKPVPDSHIAQNKEVSIWVSLGPHMVQVPYVKDMSLDSARKLIEASGLRVGASPTYDYDPVIEQGNVMQQTPTSTESRPRGSEVDLVLSKGEEPPPTPEPMPTESATPDTGTNTDNGVADGGEEKQRTFGVAWPVPPDGQTHHVRIDVIDRDGERTVYEQDKAAGDKVQCDVTGSGKPITIKLYDNDVLRSEQTR